MANFNENVNRGIGYSFARHERMPVRTSYGCDKTGFDGY